GNIDTTTKNIVNKAWEDGKKEILGIGESSKQDIMNSLSSVTTGWIKDQKTALKDEIRKDLLAEVGLELEKEKKVSLTEEQLEAKIRTIVKEMAAEK
ncbi:MAG: hypothetical protein M3Z36_02425, partial [Acidobacteriota bacterium]|nr:hypothetical protein [Acidobacteriota bacterium]